MGRVLLCVMRSAREASLKAKGCDEVKVMVRAKEGCEVEK